MKKLAIICMMAVAMLLLGCTQEKQYRIGVSQCSSDAWRTKMNEEIEREIMFHPDASVEIRSAEDDSRKQIEDIEYFRKNNFDIIIASPNEADALTPIIKETYESGIPIIIFDRNIKGDYYTAFQDADNRGIGQAAARYALNYGENPKVIEIGGLEGSTPAEERRAGFEQVANEKGIDIVGYANGNWVYARAKTVADSLLRLYPRANVVYAHNDIMAIAASDAAKVLNLHPKIIGIDAAPEIGIKGVADGKIDATFIYPTEGHRIVRTALAILKGEPYDKVVKIPMTSPVNISNADILLSQNEALREETSRMKNLKTELDNYWEAHSEQRAFLYALIAIVVLVLVVLFILLRTYWQNRRHQQMLSQQNDLLREQHDTEKKLNEELKQQRDTEKSLREQLSEATQSKLTFYTNVSHDLRTPLTLIAEPLSQVSNADNLTESQHALLKLADKNVYILRRLINQILDFRKYENDKLSVHLSEVRLAPLLREWAESFEVVAHKRHTKMTVNIELPDNFTLALDPEKMERVMFNLMSNAFKYTPESGKISLDCQQEGGMLIISIEDNGKGIDADDLAKIFDRFYQVESVHPNGSGIGLALSKTFVELHGGTIDAESELGKGSKFTISLPIRHVENAEPVEVHPLTTTADVEIELAQTETLQNSDTEDKPILLVVDDNEDMRALIRQLMSDTYNVLEAEDGVRALRIASKYVPDIIVCDVMMPVMDGLECCRRLKRDITTSHIPVMMLTACSLDEQRIQSYESGADAYLSKPFNGEMLKVRCRNLITSRRKMKELWYNSFTPESPRAQVPSGDAAQLPGAVLAMENDFLLKVVATIQDKMADANLSIDSLAEMLGMGRSQFYRKIKALTNLSPVELLKDIRLRKAHELLMKSDNSVSEIAYKVGFSSPAYFTRCYREVYGETPSDARTRMGSK